MGQSAAQARASGEQRRDETVRSETGIRVLREKPEFTTPDVFSPGGFEQAEVDGEPEFRELIDPQHRYVFKRRFLELHPFYDQLCLACGELNYRKRGATADLRGRVALLTGGRVKIGSRPESSCCAGSQ